MGGLPLDLPSLALALVGGTVWGIFMGSLPGVTGLTALVLAAPLAVQMDPLSGVVLLIAIHSVSETGGAVTAIAMGIPGTPSNAATVEDGHALARTGWMARAIAAIAIASAFGGAVGFVLLVLTLPVSLALVRLAGAPEIFAVCVLGLVIAARLGSATLRRGLIAVGLGLMCSFVGMQNATGEPRLWFGFPPLLDGFGLLPVATGLFAGPELIRLAAERGRVAFGTGRIGRDAMRMGWQDVRLRWRIVLRSGAIGWLVGVLPGIGGSVASFLSYAASGAGRPPGQRDTESRLDGIVAAEASNNAKEGGDIIPTLVLGVPGGAGMAVLYGALLMLGITPGPTLLGRHPEIAVGVALTLLLSNVIGSALVVVAAPLLVRLMATPPRILAPLVTVVTLIGVLGLHGQVADLRTCLAFAALGVVMLNAGYSRPGFILGFVLGPAVEVYGNISYAAYGWPFLRRPVVVILLLAALALIGREVGRRLRGGTG